MNIGKLKASQRCHTMVAMLKTMPTATMSTMSGVKEMSMDHAQHISYYESHEKQSVLKILCGDSI